MWLAGNLDFLDLRGKMLQDADFARSRFNTSLLETFLANSSRF
jgi:hypothetical protein